MFFYEIFIFAQKWHIDVEMSSDFIPLEKNLVIKKAQKIGDTMKRPSIKIIGIEEGEESQLKGPENIFNKIIEENFPNLKEEMVINVQEAYRTPN